jgi:hypothetical protein
MCVYLEGRDYDVGTMELQLTLWKVSDNGWMLLVHTPKDELDVGEPIA